MACNDNSTRQHYHKQEEKQSSALSKLSLFDMFHSVPSVRVDCAIKEKQKGFDDRWIPEKDKEEKSCGPVDVALWIVWIVDG